MELLVWYHNMLRISMPVPVALYRTRFSIFTSV